MKPDIEVLKKLYEFGGLYAYRVVWFDPALFKVAESVITFNEDVAKEVVETLRRNGFTAGYEVFMVKFDGAFAEKP